MGASPGVPPPPPRSTLGEMMRCLVLPHLWPGVPAGDKMGGALAGDREGFGGDFGVPRGVLREIWEGPREIWGVPRMFRVIQRNLGLSQGVRGGSAGVQGTVWGPRGCSGGPEGFWGFPRGFRVSQWVSGDPRECSRAPQEGLEKVPGRWESQWGPQGFGGPLELEEPQEVLVGSPGVLGSRGVLSHPAPRRRGRRGCGGAAGPGAAPGRAAPAAPGTARGEPPHSRSPTSPRGLRERGGKSLRKGVVRCTLYPAPPKEPHTPPAPLHPVGKQGQNCSRTGFGVFSPTPPKQPHTALVLLHPTGKGRQNPIGRRFWGILPLPTPFIL